VTPAAFVAITATVAMTALVPGPAVAAIVARAIASGARPAMAINAGVVTGDVLFLLLAAAGMAAASRTMGGLFELVKIAGAIYLVWQGVMLWQRPARTAVTGPRQDDGWWHNYAAGLLLMFGHVQAMLFYAALLPGLVDLAKLTWRELGLVASMLVVVIGGVNTGYALLASRARRFFANPSAQRAVRRVAGTLMFVAAALVLTRV
jgi:threonine/homoserine/homoserine lactone efflux protein